MARAPHLLTEVQLAEAEGLATRAAEHEMTLLVCAVHTPAVAAKVATETEPDDWSVPEYRAIRVAIGSLVERSRKVTELSLADELRRLDMAEAIGAARDLVLGIPRVAEAPNALRHIQDVSRRRQLFRALREAAAAALNLSVEDPVGVAFDQLLSVRDRRSEDHVRHVRDVMLSQVMAIEAAHEASKAGRPPVAETGFPELDEAIVLTAGKLIVLAARPGMGKSAMAWNIATNVARDRLVVLTTLEMSGEELASRVIAADLRLYAREQAAGTVPDAAWSKLAALSERFADLKLYIDDAPAATMAAVEASVRRVAAATGEKPGLVLVDYLGLLDGDGRDETEKTGRISRAAKRMAKSLRCPVILLSQLNRGVETRADKRPMLADLRQSGAIEQDADIVMFIYRDDYYNPDTADRGVAEILIPKNRGGAAGITVKLLWRPAETRFETLRPRNVGYLGGAL